jgi:putative inorganic carbon (HCO3(-)) transporter
MLFFVPILFFLVNITRNPFYVQEVLIVWIITIIFLLYSIQSSDLVKIKPEKFIWAEKFLFIFFGICFLSLGIAFLEKPEWRIAIFSEGSKAILLILFNSIFVYFIAYYFISGKKLEDIVWKVLFFASFLSSVYGIFQFFGMEIIWPTNVNPFGNRCVATFGNPNFLSSFLVLLIPLGIYKITHSGSKLFDRYFYLISTIFMIFALVCTMTRSSWVGFIVSLTVYFGMFLIYKAKDRKKVFKKFFIAGLILISILAISPFGKSLKSRLVETFTFTQQNKSIYQRLLIWHSSKDMFMDNKIIGVGWGMFESNFPFYQSKYLTIKDYVEYRTHANNCHNEILEILTQVGIVGFLAYFLFYLFLFVYLFKTINRDSVDEKDRMLIIAYLSAILGMLADNLLNVSLHFAIPMMIFWFIVGSAVQRSKGWKEKEEREKNFEKKKLPRQGISPATPSEEGEFKSKRKIVFLVVGIGLLVISFKQVQFLIAETKYFKGFSIIQNRKNLEPAIYLMSKKYLEEARSLHKYEVNNLYDLGNMCSRLGLYEEAIKAYEQAISANPGYDEIYFNLGLLYYRQGDIVKAKLNFLTSNRINPINIAPMYGLFNMALQKKEYEQCLQYLLSAENLEPENYALVNNIGAVYSLKDDFTNAMKYYEKCIYLDSAKKYSLARTNIEKANKKETGILTPFKFDLFEA